MGSIGDSYTVFDYFIF